MTDIRYIKNRILEMVQTLPVCDPNTLNTQWVVRCPYCGDSADRSHGHLSIKIDRSTDEAMIWRCFKCDASGIVNTTLLRDLGLVPDQEIYTGLRSANRKATKFNKFLNDYVEKLSIPQYSSEIAKRNLVYVNQRLGTDILLGEADRYHMILDLAHFMKYNELTQISGVSPKYAWFIGQHYTGFMTANKNTFVFRLVDNLEKSKRYLKYKVNPLNENPAGFYSIPFNADILSIDDFEIHIAEGIFDIISIERNLYKDKDNSRRFFFASCGFGPMTIIQYLVYSGLGPNLILHIYCDNDKSDQEVLNTIYRRQEFLPWCKEFWFHRNHFSGEKDYGVPKDRIIDEKRKVNV